MSKAIDELTEITTGASTDDYLVLQSGAATANRIKFGTAVVELTNKTITATSNTVTADTARGGGDCLGTTSTHTLTNKTMTSTSNTITADTARQGGNVVGTTATQTLTNKTLTSPTITTPTITWKTTSKSATYSALASDDFILVTASTTLTLPSATTEGIRLTIKSTATGVVTINAGSETIDGATALKLGGQYDRAKLISDGTNWHIEDVKAHSESGWLKNTMGAGTAANWNNVHLGSDPSSATDSYTHGLGVSINKLNVKVLISDSGTATGQIYVLENTIMENTASDRFGIIIQSVDNDNIIVQTGADAPVYLTTAGVLGAVAGEWGYNIIVERVF
jgi:hypothetical protein